VFELLGGAIFAQLILYFASPIIMRLYGPEAFGTSQIIIVTAGAINMVSSLKYEEAIVLPKERITSLYLSILCIGLNLLFFGIVLMLILLLPISLSQNINPDIDRGLLLFIPIIFFLGGIVQVMEALFTKEKCFKQLAKYKINTAGIGVITQITAGFLTHASYFGLLLGKVCGPFFGTLLITSDLYRSLKGNQKNFSWKEKNKKIATTLNISLFRLKQKKILKLAKRYKNFPIYNTLASIFNYLSTELPIWLFYSIYNTTISGYFVGATIILRTPMKILGRSVAKVFLGFGAQAKREGKLDQTTLHAFTLCTYIGFCPGVLFLFLGSEITIILGSQWYETGIFIQILAPSVIARFTASPISKLFIIAEIQRTQVKMQITQFLFTLIITCIGASIGGPRYAIAAFSLSATIKYLWFCYVLLGVAGVDKFKVWHSISRCLKYFIPLIIILSIFKHYLNIHGWVLISVTSIITLITTFLCIKGDELVKSDFKILRNI
jgi:lipopolysaccharide exporter